MIYPNIKMLVKYLDEEGNKHTIKAESIGFSGDECEVIDKDGQVIYCDNDALLEILSV